MAESNKIKDENYYVVQGWMRTQLELKGNALDIYAIIYGFSQVAHQEFTASINYLCEWLGTSRPTVINTLKDLVEKGLLTKESKELNGVIYNRYRAVVPDFTGGKKILLPSKKILPNNIDNNTDIKKQSLPKGKEGRAPKQSYNSIFSDPENSEIKDALVKFIDSCKGRSYNPKVSTVEKFSKTLRDLSKDNSTLAMLIVDQSIKKGWKDLYPLKDAYKADAVSIKHDPSKDKLAVDERGNPLVF